MTRKIFSANFRTYGEWLKAQPRTSRYATEIIRKHERFPNISLKDLRDLKLRDHTLRDHAWQSLTSTQKRDRNLSLKVLRYMRKGESLTKAVEKVGVNKNFAVKHLGKNLHKSKGKWRVNSSDTIETEMLIYGRNTGQTTIITANSKDRKLIAEYMNAVQKALRSGDEAPLKRFGSVKIIDANGEEHYLETDLDKLFEIMEAQEEPEFLQIYQS
jgi:hypothetical protein